MSMAAKNGIIDASVSSGMLRDSYDRGISDSRITPLSYPDVKNSEALSKGFDAFVRKIAKRQHIELPEQIRLHIIEDTDTDSDDNDASQPSKYTRYMIVIEDESHDKESVGKSRSIIMVYTPTMEAEAASTVTDGGVEWSPDNMSNTLHKKRTMYYMGFLSLMAEKSPGYDTEPTPQEELASEDLVQLGTSIDDMPAEFIHMPTAKEIIQPNLDATEHNDAEQGEFDTDTTSGASVQHNKLDKESNNANEEEVMDDLNTTFDDLQELFTK